MWAVISRRSTISLRGVLGDDENGYNYQIIGGLAGQGTEAPCPVKLLRRRIY